jgi:hypothetical protein
MNTLFGHKVIVHPDHPKQQLSENVLVSDEFRAKTNAWLLDFFGYTNAIQDGHSIVQKANKTIYVNPRDFERLKSAVLEPANALPN